MPTSTTNDKTSIAFIAFCGDIMRTVSKENGCEILSLRESFLALDDMKAYYSKDGMHPNEAGYALIRGDFEKYFASVAGII